MELKKSTKYQNSFPIDYLTSLKKYCKKTSKKYSGSTDNRFLGILKIPSHLNDYS